jgi:hypothetical protein
MAAKRKTAIERAEAYRLHIEWALRQPGFRGRRISFHCAAEKLNERYIAAPKGGRWAGGQLQRMAIRLEIYHSIAHLSDEVARAKVRALWKQHPRLSGRRMAATLGRDLPLGVNRIFKLLRECRLGVAKRSPLHKKVGWDIDHLTAAPVRVGAIWRRHPEFTANEVLKKLGPKHPVRSHWVAQVLRECWLASVRRSGTKWRRRPCQIRRHQ